MLLNYIFFMQPIVMCMFIRTCTLFILTFNMHILIFPVSRTCFVSTAIYSTQNALVSKFKLRTVFFIDIVSHNAILTYHRCDFTYTGCPSFVDTVNKFGKMFKMSRHFGSHHHVNNTLSNRTIIITKIQGHSF